MKITTDPFKHLYWSRRHCYFIFLKIITRGQCETILKDRYVPWRQIFCRMCSGCLQQKKHLRRFETKSSKEHAVWGRGERRAVRNQWVCLSQTTVPSCACGTYFSRNRSQPKRVILRIFERKFRQAALTNCHEGTVLIWSTL